MQKTLVPPQDYPEIEQRYRAGATYQEIADTYGVSRERIRQILDRMGVSAEEGGAAKRANERREAKAAAREARFWRKYGMGEERFNEVERNVDALGGTPLTRYRYQKGTAATREIPWNFTFASWWAIWERSGKWNERGRGSGYVMSRPGDTGPYEPGNVKIIRAGENNSEYINRYWNEVREGIRPEPINNGGPRGSKHGFHKLENQPRLVIQNDEVRRLQTQAHNYAKAWGWEISTVVDGDQLKITRVA